ncbi:conserved hypothetical protein [Rubrivivax sp. A210]|uniref:translocation/assembly module TamB domain-containing protein n=1 Tax=Rubrivivax sp. A210 TaxID=2772301 RepID=UPI001919E39A|nr:translocation/assembly module TamB domain-containing protein [Rubrivivax sp. A210]CAD5372257.1 conserved hypothetical protein [Rubrivivax sp. A210]
MAEAAPAPPPPGPPAPPGPLGLCLQLLSMPALVLLLLALVAGAGYAGARWLLASDEGARWLLAHQPWVEARGFEGSLLGGQWRAERLVVRWAGGQQSATLEGLDAGGMAWQWRPPGQGWVGLGIEQLTVKRIVVDTGPSNDLPLVAPRDLGLPFSLRLAEGRVEQLVVDRYAPVQGLVVAELALEGRAGAPHRVISASAQWQGLAITAGAAIAHEAPLAVTLDATLRPLAGGDAPAWAAVLRGRGPLARLAASAVLRGVPQGGREAPAADLRATLRPFEAWPMDALHAETQALDLSALATQLPQTRLSGHIDLAAPALAAPTRATVQITNSQPGRWNERRLPLRRLTAELRGQLDRHDRIEVQSFALDLADATRTAGRLRGSATWHGPLLEFKARLDELAPQRLDGRAAALLLSGPVEARLRGLPSPDPAATASATPLHIDWRLDLEGRFEAAPQPVRLAMEGSADDQRLELKSVRASAGPASATMKALLQRVARKDWQLETQGNLVDFDPLAWWPGEAGSVWRNTRHRLSADWQFGLRLPADADRLPALALAQRAVGNGSLRIHDSLLAGVPLAGELALGYTQTAAPTPASLRADLRLGGNQLTLDGRGDPTGPGAADHLRLDIKAERLNALAPLARLHPVLADWMPRQGTVQAGIAADGRWPALRSEGNAYVAQLAAGSLQLARGQAAWRMDGSGNQPLSLLLDLAGLQLGNQRADHLRAELRGTLADHRIELSGALPLLPPSAAVRLLGVQAQSGTRAQLQAQGGWERDAAGGGRWRARIERLAVGSWDGSVGDAPSASNWAEARGLRAELQFGADGSLATLRADAGRLQLTDALALRWDEVRADLRGEHARIDLHANIEPFALAPLLARLQPTMGWQGDMRLAARVDISAAERFSADLVFERSEGDLHVDGPDGLQLLGLTDLRVKVAVHDGEWVVTPQFRGRSLGDIGGTLRVHSSPERRWPAPEDRIEGEVQARVADIGIWRAWIPPGWQLGGELRVAAGLGGSFGAPLYSGTLGATGLSVRNLLEGVNLSDGQVGVRLDGDSARVERFTLRGGDGSLSVSGGATLGATPQARLQIKAERFRLLGRVDRLLIASGRAELHLAADSGRLDGAFTVDEGLFDASRSSAPTLDSDVTLRRPGAQEDLDTEAAAPRASRAFALSVDVDLGERLRVRGRGLDTVLRGRLHLGTRSGQLAVDGTIATERGTYAAYGQKLDIERGILAFSGPSGDPRMDVLALRPNLDVRVGVLITGSVQTPRVRLYSEPEMSDTDKLSWLMLGRAPDSLGRSDTTLLQRAAVALLAGEGEAPTDALLRRLGLDELSLHQSDGDTRETVVTLGKQLSRRWYVGYERGVNATAGTWQLIYRLAQRFTLRLQSGLENSFDVIWVLRLGETRAAPAAATPSATASPPASAASAARKGSP